MGSQFLLAIFVMTFTWSITTIETHGELVCFWNVNEECTHNATPPTLPPKPPFYCDTVAPVITNLRNITQATDEGVCHACVNYNVSATDNCDSPENISITCTPPSGSNFSVGTTDVNCTADDRCGNVAKLTFKVSIEDTVAPVIPNLRNITQATDEGLCHACVNYNVSATDNCDSPEDINITCTPPSGSNFSVGTTDVNCTAEDGSGNVAEFIFKVIIEELDFCISNPCQNGGTCTADSMGYACACAPGWTSVNCDNVGFCDLEGEWYNECNDRITISLTSTGMLLGDYSSSIALLTGYSAPNVLVGYANQNCDFPSFGFVVTKDNGKSTSSWSGQCHLCGGQEVLYTTWTSTQRVSTCVDIKTATLIGQDRWTRYKQSKAPREE